MHVTVHINGRSPGELGQLGGCSTLGGTRYSVGQVQGLLRQGGWPENLIVQQSAIVMGESSGYSGAVNACGSEHSVGLNQINIASSLRRPWTEAQLKDPLFNCQVAYQIYRQQGFRAWGAYSNGSYRNFLSAAQAAYGGSPSTDPNASAQPSSAMPSGTTLAIGTGTALGLLLLVALVAD